MGELEQAEKGGEMERFLDLHGYMTAMKDYASLEAFGIQMALDSVYKMKKRDLITGLKTRTKASTKLGRGIFELKKSKQRSNNSILLWKSLSSKDTKNHV